MEDPDQDSEAEWSIQEYYSKENKGKLRWMLNTGLTVGKKILVTGFVISSAPIVLPPLTVISIIGFACSIPYGLFLASYACTNKLMSKLLPEPEPPWYLLEYGMVSSDEEIENDGNTEKGEALELYGHFGRDKEKEEMWEDRRKSVGMRIELVENDENEVYGEGGFRNTGQELVNDNEIVEDNGYKENIDGEIELKIEGLGEEEKKQPMVDEVKTAIVDIKRDETSGRAVEGTRTTFKVTNVVVDSQNADIEEDEKIVRETTRLLEKNRGEGMADNGEDSNRSLVKPSGGAEEGDFRADCQIEVMRMPFETKNYYANVERKIEREIDENEKYKTTAESQETPETVYVQNVNVIPKEVEPKPMDGDLLATNQSEEVLEAEKPTSEMSGTTDVGNIVEGQKPVMCKRKDSQEGRANSNITKDAQQDSQLNRKKEIVIFTNADAREIANESGFDLLDTNNVAAQQYSDADFNNGEGDSEPNENGISSQENIGMDSSKVYLTEEKIMEKIEAMRVIVGYKAARQATCLEELKALYLFTGVEPPVSFKNPSDLMEVEDKLRFLMSIVGVK